ncbi:MAG: type II toxin-antitoxin system RelE/ParE family toxin [Sphingobacteriaceae bacterium]|nr:type II toxin-antitoxin system RelE/ParE family toxin [Cytophagaceae bacterium]
MSTYRVIVSKSARKALLGLSKTNYLRVSEKIDELANDPYPHEYKSLKGKLKGLCRIRAGNYRILYTVDEGELLIDIIEVGDRRDTYD